LGYTQKEESSWTSASPRRLRFPWSSSNPKRLDQRGSSLQTSSLEAMEKTLPHFRPRNRLNRPRSQLFDAALYFGVPGSVRIQIRRPMKTLDQGPSDGGTILLVEGESLLQKFFRGRGHIHQYNAAGGLHLTPRLARYSPRLRALRSRDFHHSPVVASHSAREGCDAPGIPRYGSRDS